MRKPSEEQSFRCEGAAGCPYCYANGRGRENYRNHRGYRAPKKALSAREEKRRYAVKKPEQAKGPTGDKPSKGDILSSLPLAFDMLTEEKWDDGSARERTTVLIVADGGTWKMWVNDKALNRTCWIGAPTIEELFSDWEEQLETNGCAWRASMDNRGNGGRKRS